MQFDGEFLGNNADDIKVFFGPASDPQRYEGTTLGLDNGVVTARVHSGVGQRLYVSVQILSTGVHSKQSVDYISYPKPCERAL